MEQFLLVVLIAAAFFAVLMVVFAVGRTLHRSEIGRNPAMRERGIQCTAEWMRSYEHDGKKCEEEGCGDCSLCNGELRS